MKQILAFLLIFAATSAFYLSAQDKQLTIDEAVVGVYLQLSPEKISGIQWRPGFDQYSFTHENALWVYDIDSDEEIELINLNTINKSLKKEKQDSLKYFPSVWWASGNAIRFYASNSLILYDVKDEKILQKFIYPENTENITLSPDGNHMAYTVGTNLFYRGTDNKEIGISNDRNLEIAYGSSVHRHEFGIEKGIFWSPQGDAIAFYKNDQSNVGNYPLVDITQRIARHESVKYPMAGTHNEIVNLGVFNLNTKEITYLQTGKASKYDHFLTNIAWHPDGQIIYIAIVNRGQNHVKLNSYDAKSGKFLRTLFEEKHPKYVEPLNPPLFVKGNKNMFIWQSRQDGYNHLYLYNTKGKQIKQLTQGDWEVSSVYGFSNDGKYIYISGNKENAISFDTYKINIETAEITRLSSENGSHQAYFHAFDKYFIDVYSNTNTPARYNLCDTNGKIIKTILDSKNPLEEYNLGEMSIGTLKAADGKTDLYYRLITPPDFDKNKKYPAIIYVYGGPHAQLIVDRWMGGASGWEYYMAQNGYVMLTIDNRGSANRGMEFESVIHRQMGVEEAADQMQGVEFLRNLGYIDMERLGVHGWSYGGFMTITLMTKHNDIFKVGVAGGPVTDWKYYEIMYCERYMDSPQDNPEGFEQTSLLNKTQDLIGRLMVIHGAIDNIVVWQHSLDFVNECIKNKVLVDYFVYPRHEHNVRGYDRIHLMRTITRYFDDHLK